MAFESSSSGSSRRVRDTKLLPAVPADDRVSVYATPETPYSNAAGNNLELATRHFHRSSYGPDFLTLVAENYLGNRRNGVQRKLNLITGANAEKIYRKFIRTANNGGPSLSKTLTKPIVFAFAVSHAGKRCVEFYKTWRENRSQRALQKKNDENIERTRRLPGHKLGFLDSEFDRMLGFLDSEFNRMSTTSLGSEPPDLPIPSDPVSTRAPPEELTTQLASNASNRDSIVSNSPSVVSLRFLSDMSRPFFKPSPPNSNSTASHRGPLRALNPDGIISDTASSGGSIKRSSSLRSASSMEPECGANLSSKLDEADHSSDSGSAAEAGTPLTSLASLGHDGEFTVVLLENPNDIAAIRHQAAHNSSLKDGSPWWAHQADADATKYLSTSRPTTPVKNVLSWWSPHPRTVSPSPSPNPTLFQLPVADQPEQLIQNVSLTGSPWKSSLEIVGYPSLYTPSAGDQRLPYPPPNSVMGSPAWKNYVADPEYTPSITAYNSSHFEYIGPRTTRADIPPWKHVLDGVGYPSQNF